MMEQVLTGAALHELAEKANQAQPETPEDYTVDGLRYCGKCGTPKQVRLQTIPGITVACMCRCAGEK